MRLGFAVRLAWRESRHGLRRVGLYMASITLGVAALVSIHSFRDDVARSVREEAEVLMGANARIGAGRVLPDTIEAIVDSLAAAGVATARVTTAPSMVLAAGGERVRLLQVRAVESGYPFYGAVRTSPAGLWDAGIRPGWALVDPAVLTQLLVQPGDSLVIGGMRVLLAGTVEDLPTDLGFQTAIGPRVYVAAGALEEAGLLGFGSLARYEVYLRIPDVEDRNALHDRYEETFAEAQIGFTLAEEQARSISNGIRFLGRFLALVGLAALLLGGIGVASAIHVYIRERRPGVAVLRCIGAHQGTVFLAYLLQAAALGLLGAGAGVVLGVAVQQLLPTLLAGTLPVEVTTRLSPASAAAGLGIGVWVSVIFALIPLLGVRNVPPLQALRKDFEPPRRRFDAATLTAWGALAASVLLLCVLEAPEPEVGLGFAGALAATVGVLGAAAWSLSRLTRRLFPARASYPVRQGVSNLFRPQNQTVSVTLALGFGAFVVGTVLEVERNLLDDLTVSFGAGRPNVLLFDVQPDQVEGVRGLIPSASRGGVEAAPLIPSRLVEINGLDHDALRADSTAERRPERWALRRQYRNTYRASLGPAESLVEGRWWDGTPGSEDGTAVDAGDLARVSLERDIADDLAVGLGDTLTWDVSGMRVASVVTSIRTVEWNRLEPNFFAIFEPGALAGAPHTVIMVVRIGGEEERAAFQRELVEAFPNVSALDFSRVQEAVDAVLSRVRQAVAFLGGFSALAGLVVLIGALATSRAQRMREGALLKTLGADRRQLMVVLFSEYLALGSLATATGLGLAWVAARIAVPQVFQVDFSTHLLPLVLVWAAVAGLTVAVGLLSSRRLLRRPPLAVLREAPE